MRKSDTLLRQKFKLIKAIGEGSSLLLFFSPSVLVSLNDRASSGYGEIWLASRTGLSDKLAIKVVPHETKKDQDRNAAELTFLKSLQHPNVVKYYEAWLSAGSLLLPQAGALPSADPFDSSS